MNHTYWSSVSSKQSVLELPSLCYTTQVSNSGTWKFYIISLQLYLKSATQSIHRVHLHQTTKFAGKYLLWFNNAMFMHFKHFDQTQWLRWPSVTNFEGLSRKNTRSFGMLIVLNSEPCPDLTSRCVKHQAVDHFDVFACQGCVHHSMENPATLSHLSCHVLRGNHFTLLCAYTINAFILTDSIIYFRT